MKPSMVAATLPRLLKSTRVPFLWGDPGIGKTSVVSDVATGLKVELYTLILALYDPTDLRGFPMLVGTGKSAVMRFITPEMMPTKGKGILFLDEMPQAPAAVQAAAYQLILNRRLGTYVVPDGWKIVAAGNYPRNGGVHHAMPAALANRFVHIDVECSQPDWDAWADPAGITDLTRAYLRMCPDRLHDMEPFKTGKGFPTPRTWEFADEIHKERYGAMEEFELLKGTIGEGDATQYLAFLKTARELPSIQEILLAPDSAPIPTSPGAKHAVVLMLEKNTSTKNIKQCTDYINRMDKEFQTAYMNNVIRRDRDLANTREFTQWAIANPAVLGLT